MDDARRRVVPLCEFGNRDDEIAANQRFRDKKNIGRVICRRVG
jgi:hypothetical protein